MTAEVGIEVQKWVQQQAKLAEEAAERARRPQEQPAVSPNGPTIERKLKAPLVCEVCGANFALQRTLRLHRAQHRREQEQAQLCQQLQLGAEPPAAAGTAASVG